MSKRIPLEIKPEETLSHTTIDRQIKEDRLNGGKLYRHLLRFGKKRWKGGKRNNSAGVRLIPDRVDISKRPAIVEERLRLGDWEGDMYMVKMHTW